MNLKKLGALIVSGIVVSIWVLWAFAQAGHDVASATYAMTLTWMVVVLGALFISLDW